MRRTLAALTATLILAGCALAPAAPPDVLRQQVADTERAFARTMAQRDHAAFVSFLAEETVWFAPDRTLRGKQAVADAWKPFYEKPEAPFSWEPTVVEVLDSGTLALSSGPVRNPAGQQVGTFTSVWRREAPGVWRILFDRGCGHCPPQR